MERRAKKCEYIACKHISAYLHLKGFYWLLFQVLFKSRHWNSIHLLFAQCVLCSIFSLFSFSRVHLWTKDRKKRCKIQIVCRMIIRNVEWVITSYVTVIWPSISDHNLRWNGGFSNAHARHAQRKMKWIYSIISKNETKQPLDEKSFELCQCAFFAFWRSLLMGLIGHLTAFWWLWLIELIWWLACFCMLIKIEVLEAVLLPLRLSSFEKVF